MIPSEKQRLDALYDRHVRALKLRGYSASTIDVYARAVRRLAAYFDCVPDHLSTEQLTEYFSELVESHSWGTVPAEKAGRKGGLIFLSCPASLTGAVPFVRPRYSVYPASASVAYPACAIPASVRSWPRSRGKNARCRPADLG